MTHNGDGPSQAKGDDVPYKRMCSTAVSVHYYYVEPASPGIQTAEPIDR